MRDLASGLAAGYTLTPATRNADATGTGIDLRGFGSAALLLLIGIGGITFDGSNKIELVLEHSDDDSVYAPVTAADVRGVAVTGSGIVKALTVAHAAASITELGYLGGRRYLRLSADFTGTHGTGTPMAAVVLRGHPGSAPV